MEAAKHGVSMEQAAGAVVKFTTAWADAREGIRDMLKAEGDRVGCEIAGYASLSHASMTVMKVIGDSLEQWKSVPNKPTQRPAG